jgi:hypothetical protein
MAHTRRCSRREDPLEDMKFHTIADYGWVARSVTTSLRQKVLSFEHHKHVAPFSSPEQRKWLKRAIDEEWSLWLGRAFRMCSSLYLILQTAPFWRWSVCR